MQDAPSLPGKTYGRMDELFLAGTVPRQWNASRTTHVHGTHDRRETRSAPSLHLFQARPPPDSESPHPDRIPRRNSVLSSSFPPFSNRSQLAYASDSAEAGTSAASQTCAMSHVGQGSDQEVPMPATGTKSPIARRRSAWINCCSISGRRRED